MQTYTVELSRPSTQVVKVDVPDDATWEDVKRAVLDAHIPYQWAPRDDGYTFTLKKQESVPTTPSYDQYEMYTPEGDKVLSEAVDHLIEQGLAGKFDRTELADQIDKMLDLVSAMGHGECRDTEPEWAIVDEVNARLCGPKMWHPIDRDDF